MDPFGQSIKTNYGKAENAPFKGGIPLIFGSKVGYVRPDQLERNHDWVDRWKVLLPKASSGDTPLDDAGNIVDVVLGAPIALAPGSACTQTYLVAGTFDSARETENYAHYLATKFVRFLVLQRKATQDVIPDRFKFVPMLDMSRRWTDEDLYERFELSEEESFYIEATIKPRSVNLSLDSPIPASHLPGGDKHRAKAPVAA
jgi:site-specific DNA-methyltransferase (adenine-specific)